MKATSYWQHMDDILADGGGNRAETQIRFWKFIKAAKRDTILTVHTTHAVSLTGKQVSRLQQKDQNFAISS